MSLLIIERINVYITRARRTKTKIIVITLQLDSASIKK